MERRAQIFLALVAACALFQQSCKPRPRYNVVLVSIDTLRPDHLGCYHYPRDTSPNIDRLAKEGVRFETAVSSTSWTLPAHAALFTSLPDLVHGVLWDNFPLDENRVTIAEVMKQNGYRTAGIFTGPYLLPMFRLDQGFEQYIDCTLFDKNLKGMDLLSASYKGHTTPGAMQKAKEWLEKDRSRPFFLFLHLFDVHPDLDPPPPFDVMFDPDYRGAITGSGIFNNPAIQKDMPQRDLEHLKALYDGEIRYVDQEGVGRLLQLLSELELLDRTVIIITSDHGEEFFEHGEFGHRKNLYDTTLRIPLVIWRPGLIPQGKTIDRQVRIIDLMPTVLELVGIKAPFEAIGASLVPLISGENSAASVPANFAELKSPDQSLDLEAVRTDEFKLIFDHKQGKGLYFDCRKDPGEQRPNSDAETAEFKDAWKQLLSGRAALLKCAQSIPWGDKRSVNIDDQTRKRLKALGYAK